MFLFCLIVTDCDTLQAILLNFWNDLKIPQKYHLPNKSSNSDECAKKAKEINFLHIWPFGPTLTKKTPFIIYFILFSLNQPSGSIQSVRCHVRLWVFVSVPCVSDLVIKLMNLLFFERSSWKISSNWVFQRNVGLDLERDQTLL